MKILIVASLASSLRNFRGALIEDLIARGHIVQVAAPDLQLDVKTIEWLRSKSVQHFDLPMSRTGVSPMADLVVLIKFIRLIKRCKPDVFIGYTIKPVIWGNLAAKYCGVPWRVSLITGLGYAFIEGAGKLRKTVRWVVTILYKISLSNATHVLFQNSDDLDEFRGRGMLSAKSLVTVVAGSGVDLSYYMRQSLPSGVVKFTMISRLLVDKGVREFVKAAEILKVQGKTVEFHLVGPSDPSPAGIADDEVASWDRDRIVCWHGGVEDVRTILANTHVYVLPSYREGTPRTVLEAMSVGRAVITTNTPGCRQTVVDGETGFLIPARDAKALASAMKRFLSKPELIEDFGNAGHARAVAVYDVRKVNRDIIEFLRL